MGKNEELTTLQAALSEAQSASTAKTEFISRLSYELRTPLNGLIGMLSLMEESDNLEQLKSYVTRSAALAKQLHYLISNTLDVAKIESGKLELEYKPMSRFDIEQYVYDVVSVMAEKKQIELIFQMEADEKRRHLICGDIQRLVQMLLNPVINAIQYTNPGGKVIVSAVSEPLDESSIRIHYKIKDNGIGINPKFLEKIFLPFEQQGKTNEPGSVGLGLTITKNLIDLMGGTIEIDSTPGEGTVIQIWLDFETVELIDIEGEEKAAQLQPSKYEGLRVLLVEDDTLDMEVARLMLQGIGFVIDLAANGEEAIEKFRNSPAEYYTLIFMDILMPGIDGTEATKVIRSLPREDAKQIKIVALTANAFVEDINKSLASGMNYHISKPFLKKDIMTALDELMI